MRTRRLLVPVLLLAPLLTACGGDDGATSAEDPVDSPSTASAPASSPPSAPGSGSTSGSAPSAPASELPTDPAERRDVPCELATVEEVSSLYGVELTSTGAGGGSADTAGWQYDYAVCSYDAEGELEIELSIAGAEDFVGGELGCPPLEGYEQPVREFELYGAFAQWVVHQTSAGLEPELLVCAEEGLVGVQVVADDGAPEGNQKRPSLALARLVLDRLRG